MPRFATKREAFDSLTLEDLRNFAISISTMTLTYVSCSVAFIRAQLCLVSGTQARAVPATDMVEQLLFQLTLSLH